MAETYWERKFWNPEIETMPRRELRELQKKKLFRQLIYAYEHAQFYKELYNKEKVDVYKIRAIEDFQKYVPMVDKDMVREYRERTGDPWGGLLCLPLKASSFPNPTVDRAVGRIITSTGTTGTPTLSVYNKHDLDESGELYARELWRWGVRPGDRFVNWHCMLWHAWQQVAMHGAAMVGTFYFCPDPGNWEPGFEVAQMLDVHWIAMTNRPLRPIAQRLDREGKTLKDYLPHLKGIKRSSEWAESLAPFYYRVFQVPINDTYGISETGLVGGPCKEESEANTYRWAKWVHDPEDKFFIELLDPKAEEPREDIEFGEPVITNLFFQTMAYIRWRSEDWWYVKWDPCPYCGFSHLQHWCVGRTSESVSVKGKLITMVMIEDLIYRHSESLFLPVQIIREEPQPQDKLRVRVPYHEDLVKEPERYRIEIEEELKRELKVDTSVQLISATEVTALAHKFVRVVKEKRQS